MWEQKFHAEEYLVFPENIGVTISIDEVSLSKGELYTFVTNKQGKGKKGSIIASVNSTKSKDIIEILEKIPIDERMKVKEVTLDMASNMEAAVKQAFPNAYLITDRFNLVRLAMEAMQRTRIDTRWEEIEKEQQAIKEARNEKKKYHPFTFKNEDTPKQLLARSRYILAKKIGEWTKNQKERAEILFEHYPEIEKHYHHTLELRNIYEEIEMDKAKDKIEKWIEKTFEKKYENFYSVANTIKLNQENILNFFITRNTNANAESFNAKIKLFRANLRGVVDIPFFLFRLSKLFA